MKSGIRYAKNKDGQNVAYEVTGSGDLDIVFLPDWVTNLEVQREEPTVARFLDRLASMGRMILLDKRGSGLSDPVPLGAIPTPEEWMDDVRTVLQTIRVPTLVLHRTDNPYIRAGNGRYLAEHIEGAEFKELPGNDHFYHTGDTATFLDAVQKFLTGTKEAPDHDRILATVLFTDIVGSTEHAERLGDKVGGIAVHIGARVMNLSTAGKVLVSRTVKDLVAGSGLNFAPAGKHKLKGVADDWELFFAS